MGQARAGVVQGGGCQLIPPVSPGMSIPRLVHTDIAALCPSPPELGEFGPNRWSPPPFAGVPATPAASPGQEMPECLGGLERK